MMKIKILNPVFLFFFLFFSSLSPAQNNKCESVFLVASHSETMAIPKQRPNVSKFLSSEFMKETLREISLKLPNDQLRLLVVKFRNKTMVPQSSAFKKGLQGVFSLFLLISPTAGVAQQSLFNAPSIEATEKHKFFFQEQVNLLPQEGVSNSTLDYGLGDGWSVGVSLFNVKAYAADTNRFDPDMIANLEKSVRLTPNWKIGVGTQSGFNGGNNPDNLSQFKSFSYLQNMYILPKDFGKVYFGYYHANAGFSGDKTVDGAMFGVEVPIIENKLTLMADYVSGTSPMSVGVAGLVWTTDNNTQISVGAQIPAPGSDNDYGVVFEFTKPTF